MNAAVSLLFVFIVGGTVGGFLVAMKRSSKEFQTKLFAVAEEHVGFFTAKKRDLLAPITLIM
ncbi:MAG: hypothetical protein J0I10_22675 [Verrucomicrobia bacterium]|nr:hypothetical protein [Verrucomicrobiota bacterium]